MLTMKKMRCRKCTYYNYDVFSMSYENKSSYCGLHGRVLVDPDGFQQNLDSKGSCGFYPRFIPIQLELF